MGHDVSYTMLVGMQVNLRYAIDDVLERLIVTPCFSVEPDLFEILNSLSEELSDKVSSCAVQRLQLTSVFRSPDQDSGDRPYCIAIQGYVNINYRSRSVA